MTGRTLCSTCGFANQAEARFCGGCGRPLTTGQIDPGKLAAQQAPRRLADRILASRGALRGERKLVTVMFADVQGSLDMIGDRDAEQAQLILDALLRAMIAAVHRYEGTVNQVLGDGIMAIFGAPLAHEDHAVRAACAALAIQDAVRPGSGGEWERFGVKAQLRVGLNSGVVVIAAINNDLSLDYRAVGPTTHIASRMEQTAAPGSIRLTRDTLLLAEGLIDAESLGRLPIKGVPEPVDVYELRRMNPGATRFRTRVARGLTPLVGRHDEIKLFTYALREVTTGSPRAALIHGEPGVGKSRLCFELTRSEAASAFRVLDCSSHGYEPAAPFAAITALFTNYFGFADTDARVELSDRLRNGLRDLGAELANDAPIVLGLLDVDANNAEWQALDPGPRKHRIFEVTRAFIERICRAKPLLWVLEDVHCLDPASAEFIDSVLSDPPTTALFVMMTSRTDMRSWSAARLLRRHLQPLTPEFADTMLLELLGDAPGLAALRSRLIERTYGNPFFIEETLQSLLESGLLRGRSGGYELCMTNPNIDIPPTAAAVIAARIDLLAPEVKALVQTAAVIGNEMTVDILRRIADLDEHVLLDRLAAASDSELMYQIQSFPSPLCGFRHALTHDVAYQSVLHSERKTLHARVVQALEELHRDRLGEHVERLAEHSFLGELWERSVRYHIAAAGRATSRFANQQAVDLIDRGFDIVERLPPGRTRTEFEIDLRLAGLAALLPLGDQERLSVTLFEAESLALSIDDQPRLAAIRSQISTALWMLGEHTRGREFAERALAIATEQKRYSFALSARFGLVLANHALGDFARCIELARSLLNELQGELELKSFGWAGYPAVLCRSFMSSALMFSGRFPEALIEIERGCKLADATGQPYSRIIIHCQMGLYHEHHGDFATALESLELAQRIAHEGEVRTMHGPVAGWLGRVLARLGRARDAIAVVQPAFDPEARRVSHYGHIYMLDALSLAHAHLGDRTQAIAYAQEAVDRTWARSEHVHHGDALVRLASLHADESHWNEAENLFARALDHATSRGMRPLSAECHEGLARVYHDRGLEAQARNELEIAMDLYRSINLLRRSLECERRISATVA